MRVYMKCCSWPQCILYRRRAAAHFTLYLSHSTVVVHLPGKQKVVGSNPTGRTEFFFLLFLSTFLLLTYALFTILSVYHA